MIKAGTPNFLGVGEGHPLLRRSTVLQGRRSALPYMHAESLLVRAVSLPAFLLANSRHQRSDRSESSPRRGSASPGLHFPVLIDVTGLYLAMLPGAPTSTCWPPDVSDRRRRGTDHGDWRVVPSHARVVPRSFLDQWSGAEPISEVTLRPVVARARAPDSAEHYGQARAVRLVARPRARRVVSLGIKQLRWACSLRRGILILVQNQSPVAGRTSRLIMLPIEPILTW